MEDCVKIYSNYSHLKRHLKTSHEKKPDSVKCKEPSCKQMFTNVSNMNRHFKITHVIVKRYECSECHEKFKRKLQLKQHVFKHTGEYPYKCDECGRGFVNLKHKLKHQTVHNDLERLHSCTECSLKFQKWSEFIAHRKIAHADRFECDLCHKKFFSKHNLKHHFKIHLPKDEQIVYQCPYENCPKFYSENRNLQAHIRSKHEGRNFVCDIDGCNRSLSSKQKLEHHMKLHRSCPEKFKLKRPTAKKPTKKRKELEIEKFLNIELPRKVKRVLKEDKGHQIQLDMKVEPFSSDTSDTEGIKTSNFICKQPELTC